MLVKWAPGIGRIAQVENVNCKQPKHIPGTFIYNSWISRYEIIKIKLSKLSP